MNKILKLILLSFCFSIFYVPCLNQSIVNAQILQYSTVRASHILVDTKEEADDLKSRINKGEAFETLAKKYSKCPSGQQGGDLGYFEKGQMVKEFEDSAFSLPVGQVSNPVKTTFGWHLIKVFDKH